MHHLSTYHSIMESGVQRKYTSNVGKTGCEEKNAVEVSSVSFATACIRFHAVLRLVGNNAPETQWR